MSSLLNPDANWHQTPGTPAAGTVVIETFNVQVILTPHGFYNRCLACPYVTDYTASKSTARRWANAHDEDQPHDGGLH